MTDIKNIKDLETKGFVVIPNFLPPEVIEDLRLDYIYTREESYTTGEGSNDYGIVNSGYNLDSWIAPVLEQISARTDIRVNLISRRLQYFDNQKTSFGWHQDHQPYYKWQDSYNAVNFWIPVIKPDPYNSGLRVIPQDKLELIVPDLYKTRIRGRGAKSLLCYPDYTEYTDNETGEELIIEQDLNKVSVVPKLSPGDALIMRHDIFHKSQVPQQIRLALSLRCYNSQTRLTKAAFEFRCERKRHTIEEDNPDYYADLKTYFDNKDSCLLKDIFNE